MWPNNNSIMLWFILVISFINTSSCTKSTKLPDSNGARLELIHRHSLHMHHESGAKLKQQTPNQRERFKDMLHQDGIRHRSMLYRLKTNSRSSDYNNRRSVEEDLPFKTLLRAGADYGEGQYFARFKIGTPPQKYLAIVDTGSDLTWTNCRRTCGSLKRGGVRKRRVFCADHSSSFTTLPCSSTVCKIELANMFSLAHCPTPDTPCAYDYTYFDGSNVLGIFANETITVRLVNGRKVKLNNVLVGCSEKMKGPVHLSDGLLGLGYSHHSFAVKSSKKLSGKFSYCLVDHLSHKNISNYLVFGDRKNDVPLDNMQYTELILGLVDPFYAVDVNGISLGGTMLKIPEEVWFINDGVGGTIIDSGSSLTFLTQPAFKPVMAILKSVVKRFPQVELEGLDYCFDSVGYDESLIPRLVFHFADGAKFAPPVKSYVIDAADGVKCLGIASTSFPGTNVIGNIMQQNHLWEFDLINNRLGFVASSCT